jgi:hypothetical protein
MTAQGQPVLAELNSANSTRIVFGAVFAQGDYAGRCPARNVPGFSFIGLSRAES